MTLGERILLKRKECGLSQEGLGEKLEVTRQTVYKWESDQAIPELDKLITLAQIFGVRVGWLIAEEESNQKEQAYMEAAQRIAALLAQSQAPQPVGLETDAGEASTGKKLNRFHGIVIAALVVILAAGAFKFASIGRKIASLENTNQSSLSAQNEEDLTIEVATSISEPGQDTQSITIETELTVYSAPSTKTRLVGTVAPGETAEILKTKKIGNHVWGFIQYQQADGTELTGWINLDKMELNPAVKEAIEASQPEQDMQRITSEAEVTVYISPSTTSRLAGTVAPGETAEILKTKKIENHVWGFIQYQQADGTELTGWVNLVKIEPKAEPNPGAREAADASQPEQVSQVITTETELTVYSTPSTTARLVGTIVPGETVEISKTENIGTHLWGYIQHQLADGTELTGWINLDKLEPETKPDSTK